MAGNVIPYTDLVTSQFSAAPKYMAMLAATCQLQADLVATYASIPALFDLDVAVGSQLDVVGQWVGISRNLSTPLTGVYFAFDTLEVGFNQGIWKGPFDPSTGLVALPDEFYRLVLRSRILNNQWEGNKPSAETLMNVVFAPYGYTFLLIDPSNLTMEMALIGPTPTALLLAMFKGGLFDIKPVGVQMGHYYYSVEPAFAFNINSAIMSGFNSGNWAMIL